jgi:hypothetical protein
MNYFQLLAKLDSIYLRNQGKTLSSRNLARKIQQAIPFKECKIVPNNTLALYNTNLQVSGVYDPELDLDGEPPIEIEISFPKKQSEFTLDDSDLTRQQWSNMIVDLAGTLGHEFIHMSQFRRRQFRWGRCYTSKSQSREISDAQEYYGIPDEVDAYAWTAAANMSHGLINNGNPYQIEQTGVYQIYKAVFDKKHPVVLKLCKLSKRYYKLLERQYYVTHKAD